MAGLEGTIVRSKALSPEVRAMRGDTGGPGILHYIQETEELAAEMPEPFIFRNMPIGRTISNFIVESTCEYTASSTDFWLSLRTSIEPWAENLIVGESYPERQWIHLAVPGEGVVHHATTFPVLVQRPEPVTIMVAPLNEGYPSVNITKMTVSLKIFTATLNDFDITGIDTRFTPELAERLRPRLEYPLTLLEESGGAAT